MHRLYTIACCILLGTAGLSAQSTAGTTFWLGYMENLTLAFNDAPEFSIIVTATAPTEGNIDVPATGLNIPFSVGVGTTEVFFPDGIYYTQGSELIDNRGIRITTNNPVQLSAYHYRLYFAESTQVLPASELGTSYLLTTMIDDGGNATPGCFVVVATEDNTEIEIVPDANTLGLRPAEVPFTITLNQGQNYQVQAQGELTGTTVRSLSGQPIAVFSGAVQADIPTDNCFGGADSHIWDQALPLEEWRDLYYFVPFQGQGGDRLRIVAAQDNTNVFFDCDFAVNLDEGEFFQVQREQVTVINSTGPISVWQYNNGGSCEPSGLGDPNGLQYLPADFRSTNAGWYASDRVSPLQNFPNFSTHFVTIIGPTEDITNVNLDGVPVTGFQPFPADPSWSYTQLNVAVGSHNLAASEGVQAYAYGFGEFDAYTQHLGYTFTEVQEYACLEIEREGILCVDSVQQFTYTSNLDFAQLAWDFGDNSTSTFPAPTHTYSQAGTYEVVLLAFTAEGTTVSDTLVFEIIDCPPNPCDPDVANLTITTEGNGCTNFLQAFGFTSNVTPTAVRWDFGDGGESTETVPEHFYASAGTYTVTLTLDDALGCTFQSTSTVVVTDCDPCLDAGPVDITITGALCAGELITFDPNYEQAGTPLLEVIWFFSDDQVFSAETVTTTFLTPGVYTASYFAQNAFGCFYEGLIEFTIENCTTNPCTDLPLLEIIGPTAFCVEEFVNYSINTTADIALSNWVIEGETTAGLTASYAADIPLSGQVVLFALDTDGCNYEATLNFVVNDCSSDCTDLPAFSIAGPVEFCVGTPVNYTINTTATIASSTWIIEGETTSGPNATYLSNVPLNGQVFLVAQDDNGCNYKAALNFEVTECDSDCENLPSLTIGGPEEFCVGDTVTYTPITTANLIGFSWSDTSQEVLEPTFTTSYTEPTQSVIILNAIDNEGCGYSATLPFNAIDCDEPCSDLPPFQIVGTPEICLEQTGVYDIVTTAEIVEYNWSTAGISGTSAGFAVQYPDLGSYQVEVVAVDADGCSYFATFTTEVVFCDPNCSDFILEGISEPDIYCTDSVVTLVATVSSPGERFASWLSGDPELFVLGDTLTTTFTSPGEYTILYQSDRPNCSIDEFVTIVVEDCLDCTAFQIDQIELTGDTCAFGTIQLAAKGGSLSATDSYFWILPDGSTATTPTIPSYTLGTAGSYNIALTVTSAEGCTANSTLSISVPNCSPPLACEAYLPNVFSPNDDGTNDEFQAFFGAECTPVLFELIIFDRWGGQVFQSSNPNQGWRGQSRGSDLPAGAYVYYCQYTYADGVSGNTKGSVVLVR